MDVNIFKAIRETVDWLIEKYKAVGDQQTKNKLDKIANQISTLATNKARYLAILKTTLETESGVIDLNKINSALHTAKTDQERGVGNRGCKKTSLPNLKHLHKKWADLGNEVDKLLR